MPRFSKKMIHLCVIIVIIVAIIFTALMIVLKYNQDGETNMPFDVSKICIISTIDAEDVESNKKTWELQVHQNNDIFVYVQKNEEYKKTETINTVTINNITTSVVPRKGKIVVYKPSQNKVSMFDNIKDYEATEIQFSGEKSTNIQNLQISNQGGIVAFRCSNISLGTYKSNKGKQVKYNDLLNKLKINNDDLKATVTFDVTIELDSRKSFKASFSIDIPVDDIVSKGKTSTEITDFNNIVFKRI